MRPATCLELVQVQRPSAFADLRDSLAEGASWDTLTQSYRPRNSAKVQEAEHVRAGGGILVLGEFA